MVQWYKVGQTNTLICEQNPMVFPFKTDEEWFLVKAFDLQDFTR